MAANRASGDRVVASREQRGAHHISSIAHLFFAEDAEGVGENDRLTTLEFIVTCFNNSRIAAYTCAGLVAGSRSLTTTGQNWDVSLHEHSQVPWSAAAFLQSEIESGTSETEDGLTCWEWQAKGPGESPPRPVAGTRSRRLLRWNHLAAGTGNVPETLENIRGAALSLPGGWVSPGVNRGPRRLILCLLAAELNSWSLALQLGRLLGLLAPQRLEIVVFDDSWTGAGGRYRGSWRPFGRSAEPLLLARCREMMRDATGQCAFSVTRMPSGDSGTEVQPPHSALQEILSRLTADISVDQTR